MRNIRRTVFLSQEELHLIESVTPSDVSIGASLRRLATKQAEWYATAGKKFHGAPRAAAKPQPEDGPSYDFSNAQ